MTDLNSKLSYQIIQDCYFTNRNFCSEAYDQCLKYIQDILPGKITRFSEPKEVNGWQIPPKWDLKTAKILKDNVEILDASQNPLQVIGLSGSFSGMVKGNELKAHLHYKTHFEVEETAIPFNFRQFYKPWERDWGFCVTKKFFQQIEENDNYYVEIETDEKEGYLDVFEFEIKGELDLTFYFVAHLDHPGMANDDLAGCAVGVELFNKLRKTKTRFTYKLIIVQEIMGSVYYLENLSDKEKGNIIGSLFLEMLGNSEPLKLQSSFKPNPIESHISQCLRKIDERSDERTYQFRELIGNDEIVFESYGIPMSSLSRFPFSEYHTSLDNLSVIKEDSLKESLEFLNDFITKIENDSIVEKNFEGLICLSNPKYNLFVNEKVYPDYGRNMRKLMDFLSFMERPYFIQELALKFQIPYEVVKNYLKQWEDKELLKIY